METVTVSVEVLAGILGKNSLELQSALMVEKDGVKTPNDLVTIDKYVADAGKQRLADMKASGKAEFTSMGRRMAFEDVEKHLGTIGIQSNGEDGFWKLGINQAVEAAKSKAATSEENIKSSELFKSIEKKYNEESQAHIATKQGFQERISRDLFNKAVRSAIVDPNLSLALPDNETILETQIKGFSAILSGDTKFIPQGDTLIPVGKDGKQLEDENYIPMTLQTFIARNAKSYWQTKTPGNDRTPPPAGDPAGKGAPGTPPQNGFPKWKTGEEYSEFIDKAISEKKDTAFLNAAQAAYESQTQ